MIQFGNWWLYPTFWIFTQSKKEELGILSTETVVQVQGHRLGPAPSYLWNHWRLLFTSCPTTPSSPPKSEPPHHVLTQGLLPAS